MGATDLFSPENLFMAPRIANKTPVMPAVQMMMAIHFRREISLYQGTSGGSTQTSSCRAGSLLLPAVSGRREERVSGSWAASLVPSPPPACDVGPVLWAVLASLEKTTSGKGF